MAGGFSRSVQWDFAAVKATVRSAWNDILNGRPVTDWKIRHSDIMAGGELVFEMCGAKGLGH